MVERARVEIGIAPGADAFRGLYVSEADLLRYLADPRSIGAGDVAVTPLAVGALFQQLGARFQLSQQELDAILIALAPEIDARYERIFAYLQDDVNRKRPSVDLILDLLCGSPEEKLAARGLFAARAPLRGHRLIELLGEDRTALARREAALNSGVVTFLLGGEELDGKLAQFAVRAETPPGRQAPRGLSRMARRAAAAKTPLCLYFLGGDESEKRDAAAALATEMGCPLLIADLSRAARLSGDLEQSMRELARDAHLRDAIVLLERVDTIVDESARDAIFQALPSFHSVVVVSSAREPGARQSRTRGMATIAFPVPDWRERRRAWQGALAAHGGRPNAERLDALAECFHFDRAQITATAEDAASLALQRGERLAADHVFESARVRSGHELASLTRKIAPAHGWDDIVLPSEELEQLREIGRRVTRRHHVLGQWGFARKLSSGKGVNALFHGHTGTGKTMAAEVVARELRLDLYKIDLAGVVSKYIGETEKNLDRIFAAAEHGNAILLFDEADALFGKRSQVRDSHDRYANLEVSYLLQKMEQYEGVSILATNLRQNLDDAFLRRLTFTISFPFPDEASRAQIWARVWPREAPLAANVDPHWLAARFLLSGGNIRNVALAAAYLAVEDGGAIALSHVLRAVRAEFQKMGKTLAPSDLAPPLVVASGEAARAVVRVRARPRSTHPRGPLTAT